MGDKAKSVGGGILRYVIIIVVFILLGGGYAFIKNYVSSHSKQFSQADYEDMNPLVEAGEELPVGKLGRISIRWVPGCFASEENTYTTYGVKFDSGKSYYYIAILDNFQVIAIQASDEKEIQRLDQMANDYEAAENVLAFDSQDFEGKIEKLTNKELKKLYDETMVLAGFTENADLFSVQYIILNTAAIPTQNTLIYLGIAALAIIAVIVVVRLRKKNRQEEAQAAADQAAAQAEAGQYPENP